MAEADLQLFLAKVRALQAFAARVETDAPLRAELAACRHHHAVVALAEREGFAIGRRWGEPEGTAGGDANLLGVAGAIPPPGEERFTTLQQGRGWRLQRIHSCGAGSAAEAWTDQHEHEWVCLLQGSARLRFADEPHPRDLSRGDSLYLAPHRLHRVEATDAGAGTIWLVLLWGEEAAAAG